MTRRTIELVTAIALGALWATAVREPSVAAPSSSVEQPRLIVAAQAQRRSWIGATTTTTWELVGTPGHHPQVELRISVSNAD